MKTKFNKNSLASLSLVCMLAVTFFVPVARAETTPDEICVNLEASTVKINQSIADNQKEYTDADQARRDELATTRAQEDKNLADVRAQSDAHYAGQYKLLIARSTNNAQKKAVARFQAAITKANNARRTQVDAAIKTYREGIDALVKDHADKIDEAFNKMTLAIDTALSDAKTSCSGDGTIKTSATISPKISPDISAKITTSASESIKAAREEFDATITTLDAPSTTTLDALPAPTVPDLLSQSRDQAMKAAETQFNLVVVKETSNLKTAFGEK